MSNGKWKSDMTAENRYQELQEIMQQIIPFDPNAKGRSTKDAVLARRVIAFQMRRDGFPVVSISRAMKRHHSIIVDQTNDLLMTLDDESNAYLREVQVWKQFRALVKEADGRKDGPVYTSEKVISLGEFRRLTAKYPDETPLRLARGRMEGLQVHPTFEGNELLICTK